MHASAACTGKPTGESDSGRHILPHDAMHMVPMSSREGHCTNTSVCGNIPEHRWPHAVACVQTLVSLRANESTAALNELLRAIRECKRNDKSSK